MKELAAAALYSVEEVLQSPNAFQKNMKTTCEEANQTPIRMDKSDAWRSVAPRTLTSASKKAVKAFKTTSNQQIQPRKKRYALDKSTKETTDWDAITSNHSEDDAIKDDGKYRYNKKGFLEDDESDDDSILIVDPGWDDYSLQALKLNCPVPLCPEARRARM
ncbi:hypothetical protein Tco_0627508 [Tanacetum coccineum]|uniref:Uncharacterized protein n=1 Tax=Tanacetum coccineum TaxID=301880 RepID=A0ABQ4WMM4_9ASTR